MWIHWPFFPKTWTKGHWPLDDLWPHVCWGHMCDSTQGSLCPSPMTIHQCMWIQWSILQITTYIHTHTTYILHTTYRMSDHIVSYWTQFRRDKKRWIILTTYLRSVLHVEIQSVLEFSPSVESLFKLILIFSTSQHVLTYIPVHLKCHVQKISPWHYVLSKGFTACFCLLLF